MRTLWQYYKNMAISAGRTIDKDGNEKVAAYSIAWFYEGYHVNQLHEELHTLTQAFLGNEIAYEQVQCITDVEADAYGEALKEFCTGTPNASQLRAIAHAMKNDITIIQGPPGTGKTATIQNLLRCLMQQEERPKVAVVSSNSEAIDNIVDLVKADGVLKDIYAYLGRQKNRREFVYEHAEVEEIAHILEECKKENGFKFASELLNYYPIMFSTIHSLRKCILSDDTFDGTFDYVIVDECSQVGSVLGLLAIESAKHLVLLGDDEQLAPIHHESGRNPEARLSAEYYFDCDDNSFMKACKKHFGDRAANVFLDEHYRCHPAIIGFCNNYVYDNKLKVRSAEDGKLPIRVRWYEGDYWETLPVEANVHAESSQEEESPRMSHHNQKQISVFMEDEYPYILQKMRENENYSVCVLSPYRYPLQRLSEEIISYNQRIQENIEDPELEQNEDPVEKIPQLTIHKAQGRGYDLVYILTVVDCGTNLWPQRKPLINVAVSRAKKELCLIASSTWMPMKIQEELLGYSINNTEHEKERYVKKLIEYVIEETTCRESEGYGLQKTSLSSVFDKVLYYREKRNCRSENKVSIRGRKPSAPEYCVLDALWECKEIRDSYDIYREIPLANVDGIEGKTSECTSYIQNGARFDIVIAKDDEVHAIIEVDGLYHRNDAETGERDVLKDEAVLSLGEEFYKKRYLRLPTNGVTRDEISVISAALKESVDDLPLLKEATNHWENYKQQESLINEFNDFMRDAALLLQKDIEENGGRPSRSIHTILETKLNFQNGNNPEEAYADGLCEAVYLLRYGYAYAIEYAVMYEILLKSYKALEMKDAPILGVCSMGCGSGLDAWALAYAKAKLMTEDNEVAKKIGLRYYGVDLRRWKLLLENSESSILHKLYPKNNPNYPGSAKNSPRSIVQFIKERRWYDSYNVLCFPKILNELDEDIEEELLDEISEAAQNGVFDKRNEIYICISHSKNDIKQKDGIEAATRIIKAINYNDEFVVDDTLPLRWNEEREAQYHLEIKNPEDDENYKYYGFVQTGIWEEYQTGRFSSVYDIEENIYRISEFEEVEEVYSKELESLFRKPIKYVNNVVFQIIKLTRKRKEGEEE